eukprot:Opistho-2@56067
MIRSRHIIGLLVAVACLAVASEAVRGQTLTNPKFFVVGKQRFILACLDDATCSVRNNADGTWAATSYTLPLQNPTADTTFTFDSVTWGLSAVGLYRQNPSTSSFDIAGLWQCDSCDAL